MSPTALFTQPDMPVHPVRTGERHAGVYPGWEGCTRGMGIWEGGWEGYTGTPPIPSQDPTFNLI